MNILLVCAAGMSTSLLVKKMQNEAGKKGINVKIEAKPISELGNFIEEFDVVLVGPQMKYKESYVKEIVERYGKKYMVIPPVLYGMVDGEKTLELALNLE